MVGKEAVLGAVGDPGDCTINALSREQHTGTGGNVYGRVGRIAKSANVPAATLDRHRPPARFCRPPTSAPNSTQSAPSTRPRVITYCGGGIAASTDALALVMLGHPDVKLYDASMSEWSNDDSLPMETGGSRKVKKRSPGGSRGPLVRQLER